MSGISVFFTMSLAQRAAFSSLFFGGTGITATILFVLTCAFLYWNQCQRIQNLGALTRCGVVGFWYTELVVRLVILVTMILVVVW
jgi:hypothetical protein